MGQDEAGKMTNKPITVSQLPKDERTYSAVEMAISHDCGYRAGLEEGVEQERKRIVKWLRWYRENEFSMQSPNLLADDIEAGEHLK